ncbi:hypothetical protein Q8F55_003255 [Vanrija albida]|uniref:DUF1996 domain-containing protein n=1 Tax=Vanrija albida TaxID=181172 RepID=A0ABR3QBY2_9TREE
MVAILPLLLLSLAAPATLAAAVHETEHHHWTRADRGEPLWVLGSDPIAITRIDPIVDPGKVGGHVHTIFGASNFRSTLLDPTEQQKGSACTKVKVHADRSNYWFPLLYFHNANGTYSAVNHGARIYYLGTKTGAKIHAFPPGLRMIAGLAKERKPWDIRAQGHMHDVYFDRGSDVPGIVRQFLPNSTTHRDPPKTINTQIVFPSCGWANQSLDSHDHFSHMAWPIRVESDGTVSTFNRHDRCPDTHPIQYPTILVEVLYQTDKSMRDQWGKTGRSEFIFSNGDVTGLTYHGDFVSGWDVDVMTDAIDNCNVGDDIHLCPAFAKYDQVGKDNCTLEGEIVAEDIGLFRPLDKLPGCNPYWGWDGPDTKPEDCGDIKTPGFVAANLQYERNWLWTGNKIPYVVPGLDLNNFNWSVRAAGLATSTGPFKEDQEFPGALRRRPTNITYFGTTTDVLVGTQEEVDAAANTPNSQRLPPNANAALYAFEGTQGTPTAAGDAKGVIGTAYPFDWVCNDVKYWNGATCEKPPQTKGSNLNPAVDPAKLKADPNIHVQAPQPAATASPTAIGGNLAVKVGNDTSSSASGTLSGSGAAAAGSGSSTPIYSGTAWSNATASMSAALASGSAANGTTPSSELASSAKSTAEVTGTPSTPVNGTEVSGSSAYASVSHSVVPTAGGTTTAAATNSGKPAPGRCRPKRRRSFGSRL